MIETDLQAYLAANLAYDVVWGNIDPGTDWEGGAQTINFFKVTTATEPHMPVFLDGFQISARSRYVDEAQAMCNEVIDLLHGFSGAIGSYLVTVTNASCIGQLQESLNIVHVPAAIGLKYTGL